MFENITKFLKKFNKKEKNILNNSKDAAKERLHLVLMQDRANVSADFLELMKQEIIDVIKKYIEVDEKAIDVRLTNKENEDGTNGAPALYANIPILNIKNEARKVEKNENKVHEENKNETDNEKVVQNKNNINKNEEKENLNNKEPINSKQKTEKENNSTKEIELKSNSKSELKETEKDVKEEKIDNKNNKAKEKNSKQSEQNTETKIENKKKEKVKTEE